MKLLQSKVLKQRAASVLSQSKTDYRRVVCLHAAISLGATLLLAFLDLILSLATQDAGGLAGMGIRALFETLRSLLSMSISLALPFWQIAILYTSIRVTREQDASASMLTRGFHRFGPVLRYYLLMFAIVLATVMAASYIAVPFGLGTAMPPELEAFLMTADEAMLSDPQKLIELLPLEPLIQFILPMLLVMVVITFAVMLYLSYRFRLSPYLLLDDPQVGAVQSLSLSGRMTKGHKWSLFKLDLSFWWYYLLQALLSCLTMLPMVLQIYSPVVYLLFQLLSTLGTLALMWQFGAYVEITYACAYDELRTPPNQITIL